VAGGAPPAGEGDADLVARSRRGDRAAFGLLVERHHGTLGALVRQKYGPRAPVEDIVQETFARALRSMDGFRGEASFLTWAATIALHVAADGARRERRRDARVPTAPLDAADPPPSGDPGPESIAAERDESRRAREALDLLPPAHRAAVTLRIVESVPYPEVAARLGTSEATARQWVSRGVRALREALRESGSGVRHA
jgi:RNA polymerase sigma-70 factor (ECF subfamily)